MHRSHNRVSAGAFKSSHSWFITLWVNVDSCGLHTSGFIALPFSSADADCAGCSMASVSVLQVCVQCMLLHTLAHDSGDGLCCLSEEHSKEFPTQGAQAWSHLPGLSRQDRVCLEYDCMHKHTNMCFSQVGLSSSSNVDFSELKQFLRELMCSCLCWAYTLTQTV